MTENKANLSIVNEEETELTPKQQAKEKKKADAYKNGMITRIEAFEMAKSVAQDEVTHLAEFVRDPLRVNMIQNLAVVDLLIEKGLIATTEEFNIYLNRAADRLLEQANQAVAEEKANAEEESGTGEQGSTEEEKTEEQPS